MSFAERGTATALTTLALTGAVLLLPPPAAADGSSSGTSAATTKAGIEHAERQAAAPTHPSKAEVEHSERATGRPAEHRAPSSQAGGAGAAAWQLGLSAALGALVTGGAVVAGRRRLGQHRQVVAP